VNEVSRYELFCQLRSQIRGSRHHLLVGIDIAKDRHHAFFGTATGKTLWKRLLFSNDLSGYNSLIGQVELLMSQQQLDQVAFGLEPTGNYHKPLAHWLIKKGHMVVLVSGKAVSDNRQLLDGRWDKHDSKDSANVADLISQGKCQFYDLPDEHISALRNLISVRKRLKKEEHSLRMQIRNGLLAKYFPEMDRFWASSLEENLAIIRWYLDPQKIAATKFNEFVDRVAPKNRGVRQRRRLEAIYNTAKQSIGLPVESAAVFEANLLVNRLNATRQHIAQTMTKIQECCYDRPEYQLLMTIPGFGPYIAALVVAAIGNAHRFSSYSQVLRLAGLDLNANRSGKNSDTRVPKISKRGNSDLRYGLYQAAVIASYHNPQFRNLYHRIQENRSCERGIKTKARVKMAAKMLVIAWTMMKNNEPFCVQRLAAESGQQR
jgi:transposase